MAGLPFSIMAVQTFYIAGPTAVGKTQIAAEVASRCNAEIVSADAFQIYQGLDILTSKPSYDILKRVPHHLIGVIPLAESCDAARFAEMARAAIANIATRGRLALVVGGTGFYMRALIGDLPDLPRADPDLRAELESLPLDELGLRLSACDPVAMSRIDSRNPRRLVRALEVCLLTGKPFSSFRLEPGGAVPGVVLTRSREDLHERINTRTLTMFDEGVVREVANVGEVGATASQVIGLREIRAHLDGEMPLEECIERIQGMTRQYAKRQLTWFRRQTSFYSLKIGPTPSHHDEIIDSLVERVRASS